MWDALSKLWLVHQGRQYSPEPYRFLGNEVISQPFPFYISYLLKGMYLNLHPTLYAVCIFSDGRREKYESGGAIIPLPPGQGTLHYVDKTNRQGGPIKVTENTLDVARVSLTVKVTYRIVDPIRVFDIQNPVDTFLFQIESDLKEYIRSRRYEELIGDGERGVIDTDLVVKYVLKQFNARHLISKIFLIMEVVVQDKEGDPVHIEKIKAYNSQKIDGETKIKIQDLDKKLTAQDAEMEKIRQKYKSELEALRAQSEFEKNEIRKKIAQQEIDVQKMRDEMQQSADEWKQKQEKWVISMGVIETAVKSNNFHGDVAGLVGDILAEMRQSSNTDAPTPPAQAGAGEAPSPSRPADHENKLDVLTNKLRRLLER